LQIPSDFKDWAVARLREMNKKEVVVREQIYGNQRREYEECVHRIDNLIDMRANGEITADEFKNRKTVLLSEKERLQELLKDMDKRVENWLETAERIFNFAEKAKHVFETTDDLNVKKEIFCALGSDFILQFKKLRLSLDNALLPVRTAAEEARKPSAGFELAKKQGNKAEIGQIYARNPVMLPG
jgi:hypothetical protein